MQENKAQDDSTYFLSDFFIFYIWDDIEPDYILCWAKTFNTNSSLRIDKLTSGCHFPHGCSLIESVAIKSRAGQAKVIGTIIYVGGAMLLSFYHGSKVPIGESPIHWNYVIRNSQDPSNQNNHQKYLVFVISQIASSNFEGVVQSSVLGNERSNNVGQWE
ncbi:uncharacterized protein LOC141719826 isoform X2 [Apium graveolens]|uniref:uncharacterized protein LOC141700987 isoform X2 n=1 Tax=Apium graveolens TaxID=4045 RepID=UPI003D7B1431